MSEEKKLLYSIIEHKLVRVSSLNKADIIVDNVNLVDLLKSIIASPYNISAMTDIIIEKIANESNNHNNPNFASDITNLRNYLSHQISNNLKIELTPDQTKLVNQVIENLKDILENKGTIITNVEEVERQCNDLLRKLKKKELINNFDFIEEITKEYNIIDFDNNMLQIMKYINRHNLAILKTPKKTNTVFDLRYIRRPKLDEKVLEMLNKINVDYKALPNYLIGELKRADVNKLYETYNLVKKNRAEEYGILHLVKKENIYAKIVLILYSSPESIKGVVDSVKDQDGIIDISLLKIILNNTMTAFFNRKNEYFRPRYYDYMSNVLMLKDLGINYRELIRRDPLFLITDNEVLTYSMNYLEQKGINKRDIVNKCYKNMANDATLIVENVDLLYKYNIDMNAVLATTNYNILKVSKLGIKLNYIAKKYGIEIKNENLAQINRLLISKIYHESNEDRIVWSD